MKQTYNPVGINSTQVFYDGDVAYTKADGFSKDEILVNIILSDMLYSVNRYAPSADIEVPLGAIVFNERGINNPEKCRYASTKTASLIKNFWLSMGMTYIDYRFSDATANQRQILFSSIYEVYLKTDFFTVLQVFNKSWNEDNIVEKENYAAARKIGRSIWLRAMDNVKSIIESESYIKECIESSLSKVYLILDKQVQWEQNFSLIQDFTFIITPIYDMWRVHCVPTGKNFKKDAKIPIKKSWKRMPPKGVINISRDFMWVDCVTKEAALNIVSALIERSR